MHPWRVKANRIIAELCGQSYRLANTNKNGTRKKRHVAYSVPAEADFLVNCLNHDQEEAAKAMFHRLEILGPVNF